MTNLTEIATPTVRSSFVRSGETLIRTLETPGGSYATHIEIDTGDEDLLAEWWRGYLRGQKPIHLQPTTTVSTAELFCGPGGLAQGFGQAALETGHIPRSLAAADLDPEAVSVYESNHRPETSSSRSVTELIDYRVRWRDGVAEFRFEPELIDDDWARHIGEIDVLMAGPPCQGHSNLNNHSRRTDKRNELYLSVAAFAVATKAQAVIIENVFFLPGLGRLVLQAITQRDLIVVESVVMLLVLAVILVNFVVELAYAWIDPRLRKPS